MPIKLSVRPLIKNSRSTLMVCALSILIALGATGCRVRSVDKATYVAANEAILRSIPIYGQAKQVNSYSIGQPAPDGPPWHENGPPYDAFYTWHVFVVPPSATCAEVGNWYRSELPRRGWRWLNGYPIDASYVHGHALIHVSCSGAGARAAFSLSVDHDER